jgi:hypothetical protein
MTITAVTETLPLSFPRGRRAGSLGPLTCSMATNTSFLRLGFSPAGISAGTEPVRSVPAQRVRLTPVDYSA